MEIIRRLSNSRNGSFRALLPTTFVSGMCEKERLWTGEERGGNSAQFGAQR
jgi:hypothetical protein